MSTLAIFFSLLPIVTLSLFAYTEEECDYINILGVYASSTENDTLLIDARNDRTDNVFTTRACMPNPRWKIYDTRLSTNIKFYGEQAAISLSNPECLLDQTYEIPKDTDSISTARGGDYASFRLELWVTNDTNAAELACYYEWSGLISIHDVCDYAQFEGFWFTDGDSTADTLIMNITMPWNDYTCSYFAYPTFKLYNNANNKLWGKMDRMAQTYCLVSGQYPVVNNGTTDDIGFVLGELVSITIELWNNWRTFACSWDWEGRITYDGSVERTTSMPSLSPTPAPVTEAPSVSRTSSPTIARTGLPSIAPTEMDEDILNTPSKGYKYIVYHIGIMVLMLLSL